MLVHRVFPHQRKPPAPVVPAFIYPHSNTVNKRSYLDTIRGYHSLFVFEMSNFGPESVGITCILRRLSAQEER